MTAARADYQTRRVTAICAAHQHCEGPLLPILHEVQRVFGCVDPASEALIANALNLSRAEVHGVVSFYSDFSARADPRPVVQICRAEACKARGVEALMADAQQIAGDKVRLETVYCLGLCAAGPAARCGDRLHARLDTDTMAHIIEDAAYGTNSDSGANEGNRVAGVAAGAGEGQSGS